MDIFLQNLSTTFSKILHRDNLKKLFVSGSQVANIFKFRAVVYFSRFFDSSLSFILKCMLGPILDSEGMGAFSGAHFFGKKGILLPRTP